MGWNPGEALILVHRWVMTHPVLTLKKISDTGTPQWLQFLRTPDPYWHTYLKKNNAANYFPCPTKSQHTPKKNNVLISPLSSLAARATPCFIHSMSFWVRICTPSLGGIQYDTSTKSIPDPDVAGARVPRNRNYTWTHTDSFNNTVLILNKKRKEAHQWKLWDRSQLAPCVMHQTRLNMNWHPSFYRQWMFLLYLFSIY